MRELGRRSWGRPLSKTSSRPLTDVGLSPTSPANDEGENGEVFITNRIDFDVNDSIPSSPTELPVPTEVPTPTSPKVSDEPETGTGFNGWAYDDPAFLENPGPRNKVLDDYTMRLFQNDN